MVALSHVFDASASEKWFVVRNESQSCKTNAFIKCVKIHGLTQNKTGLVSRSTAREYNHQHPSMATCFGLL
jgi:hypothetical protein